MISLSNISNLELISRMEKLVRTERKITHLILQYILEIEDRKLYADLGYDGMFTYLTRGLGYSEASAYRRLQSAKLLRKVPEISTNIEEGNLNLSQLTLVQKCLKEKKQKTGESISSQDTLLVLEKIQNKNSFETEKVLAVEFDRTCQTHEKVQPQKNDSVRLEITLTQEQFSEIEQAKSLLSHICPDGNLADVISTLAKIYNRKKLEGRPTATQSVIASKDNDGTSKHNLQGNKVNQNQKESNNENKTENKINKTTESKNQKNPIPKTQNTATTYFN
ncbi:MAG: hypothetical protein ACXVCP_16020 [Bdellovibrio sp.]